MRVRSLLKIMAFSFTLLGLANLFARPVSFAGETIAWKEAGEGLLVAELNSAFENVPYALTLIKIDPKKYSFSLLCATEHGKEPLTTRLWAEKHGMLFVANAGMFQANGLTSVGFMKNFDHVNNPRLSKSNSIMAFNPVDSDLPQTQIIDRECQDFSDLRQKYQSLIQSIRMISCKQENVWSTQGSKWSTLAVGMDADGQVLFLFSRTPHTVHDFIDILLSLPLSLKNTMYLEGGPQASLYLSTPKMTIERNGIREGIENESLTFPLPVPNVIGVSKKDRP